MELLIAVGFFGVISGLVYFVLASRAPVAEEAIQRRLADIGAQGQSRTNPSSRARRDNSLGAGRHFLSATMCRTAQQY
jgi:hypothetical protein